MVIEEVNLKLLLDERPEGYRLVVRNNGRVARRRKLNPEERQLVKELRAAGVTVNILPAFRQIEAPKERGKKK